MTGSGAGRAAGETGGADEAARRLVSGLRERGQTLAVAESCTGGLLGAWVTSVAGASAVFWGGVISYDDAAKRDLLGVSPGSLEREGAVSRTVALEMARGVRRLAGTTWSLAVTGIAGPGGGSDAKPVGTVWVALDGPVTEARVHVFGGDREAVRRATAVEAMNRLCSRVSETDQ